MSSNKNKSEKSSILTIECIDEIIQHLLNDKNTLYSFLLANRYFCRKVVPLLWSKPFSLLIHPSKTLVRIFVLCLNIKEKSILFNNILKVKDGKIEEYSALFDYPALIRELDFWGLFECVRIWIQDIRFKYSNTGSWINDTIYYLIRVLIRRGQNIKYLHLVNNDKIIEIPPITCLPKADVAFSKLQYLYCGGYHADVKLYPKLVKYCKDIIEINIVHYHKSSDSSLAALIKSQRRLKKITYRSVSGGTWRLVAALSQTHFLKSVNFTCTDFTDASSKGLATCDNLEVLELLDCRGNNYEKFWKPIIERSKFRLKRLSLARTSIDQEAIEILIQNAGEMLEEVTVDYIVISMMPYFLEMLIKNCPNIIYLKLFLCHLEEVSMLFSTISNAFKLKQLVIRTSNMDVTSILPGLATLVPSSLRLLDIDMMISSEALQEFLNECKAPIQRIILNAGNAITDDHIVVLTQYAKERGCLKSLGYTYRTLNWGLPYCISQEIENKAKELISFYNPEDPADFLFPLDRNDELLATDTWS
ncbi:15540_t:CDS:1 [Dentiscutata erythropus]|uniref:15540_t:CDS:1 n=1 Tax=Dentiscutata erythropus TaxID=1348616 RepID=A0A9N8VH68_9GLOM|nr:15540_t:CDS:1 [Dentiscutata erythropus]